jgi:hypothetical protein
LLDERGGGERANFWVRTHVLRWPLKKSKKKTVSAI